MATPKEDVTLHTFTAEASAGLAGPDWLRARRAAGYEAFASSPLPSESEEVWRYTPIDDLDLDDFAPPAGAAGRPRRATSCWPRSPTALGPVAGSVLVHNGRAGTFTTPGAGRAAGSPSGGPTTCPGRPTCSGAVQEGGDALVRLNDAFAPDPVFVDVPAGLEVDAPVLIVHWCDAGVRLPPHVRARRGGSPPVRRRGLRRGRGRRTARSWCRSPSWPPPTARRSRTSPCRSSAAPPGRSPAWPAAAGPTSSLRTFTVGLGASYDRVRADVSVEGRDARSEILSAYLGDGTQVHDIRTLQDHVAPRTTSELLCQGAVAGTSRSVYSGLIRVHRGAVRSDARQTNHNLVLDEGAHADSVPNLDILENDVRCSHASTVGPIDEDQRYYIESRGVAPEMAEGLIVRGFFDAIIDRSPVPEVVPFLQREVHERLDVALGGRALPAGV